MKIGIFKLSANDLGFSDMLFHVKADKYNR